MSTEQSAFDSAPPRAVRDVAKGSLTFTGPADLLETPSNEEILGRIAATPWRTDFDRVGIEDFHRMGLIETRFQLNYHCSQPGILRDIVSYGHANGVAVRANPISRGRTR